MSINLIVEIDASEVGALIKDNPLKVSEHFKTGEIVEGTDFSYQQDLLVIPMGDAAETNMRSLTETLMEQLSMFHEFFKDSLQKFPTLKWYIEMNVDYNMSYPLHATVLSELARYQLSIEILPVSE